MENVVLAIHLIVALLLVGVVLLQRSEGGGLGIGGGGGGVVSGRAAATALGKVTWGLAIAFIATSITLTILSARDSASSSVIDQIGGTTPAPATAPATGSTTAPAAPNLGAVPTTPAPSSTSPAIPPPAGN